MDNNQQKLEYKIRSKIADRIQAYLEDYCIFRDYEIRPISDYGTRDKKDNMICYLYQPTKSLLDSTMSNFCGRYSKLVIFV